MLAGYSGHLISEDYLESRLTRMSSSVDEERRIARSHQALSSWRTATAGLGPASSLRAMLEAGAEPLVAALGFGPASRVEPRPRALTATIAGEVEAATLLVTFWGEPLDRFWSEAVASAIARRTLWCLLFNGTHLRITDAGRVSARRHAEFEIDAALDEGDSFTALWHLVTAGVASSPQQGVGRTALHDLVDESDRHAAGVCRALKDGVLQASTDVLTALVTGRSRKHVRLEDAFEQALTIVYRLVFLLFAEARTLVPMWHPIYRAGYSVEALRADAFNAVPSGLWDTLRAMTRLAHAGCEAGDLRVTPFNGRLFAPAVTPLAERRNLDEDAARRAVLALSTRRAPDGAGLEPIAYRDLGVEQLGSVYETLLDYEPHAEARIATTANGRMATVGLRMGSGVRKSTGTFYTPQPLAEYLVRRTLAPLVHEASPDQILELRIVDPAMGSGAFLVAACRYMAARYETALVERGDCRASDIDDGDRARMRRTIATRCLYGVDVNPMAVQLARLSLWLVTLAGDRPLSFLDHRLQTGDSLVGAWLSALRRPPTRRRPRIGGAREPRLFEDLHVSDALGEALPVRFSLETGPDDSLEAIRAKERAFKTLSGSHSPLARWRAVADVWCACWLATDRTALPAGIFPALSDALLSGRSMLPAEIERRYLDDSRAIARDRKAFHWELEFPEVFFDATGTRLTNAGFDAVIGNPPWDMLRGGGDAHKPRAAQTVRFARDSRTYDAQSGGGHANLYQLFVERGVSLTRTGGRIGLVVPAGFATDTGSRALRRFVFARADVDSLVGFDNHRAIFPIHRSMRFLLLTASRGQPTESIACRFGVDGTAPLESAGDEPARRSPWFPVHVSMALAEQLSGDDCAIPWLVAPMDITIAERAASLFPALGSRTGWEARFGRELNASDDKGAFHESGRGLAVLEGKNIEPFRVHRPRGRHSIRPADAGRLLPERPYERARLAYRDVAGVANRLTLIAAIIPPGAVTTHTLFCLRTRVAPADQYFLCGMLNTLVLNYLARMRVSTHVTTAIVERLPVPTRAQAPAAARRIARRARILAARPDDRIWAELQADAARLYQLSRDEFAHVLSTFPLVDQEERDRALAAFDAM